MSQSLEMEEATKKKFLKVANMFKQGISRTSFIKEYKGFFDEPKRKNKKAMEIFEKNIKNISREFDKIIERNQKDITKKDYLEIIKNKTPYVIKVNKLDKIKFFSKFNVKLGNVHDIESFYQGVKVAKKYLKDNKIGDISYITMFFKDVQTGSKVRHISFTASDLYTYNDFINKYNQIKTGQYYGSDSFSDDDIEPIFNWFGVSDVKLTGYGDSNKILFNTIGITDTYTEINNILKKDFTPEYQKKVLIKYAAENKELIRNIEALYNKFEKLSPDMNEVIQVCKKLDLYNDCAKRTLLKIFDNNEVITKKILREKSSYFETIEQLIYFLGSNCPKIVSIISNSFIIKNDHRDIIEKNPVKITINEGKKKKMAYCSYLNDEDIELSYFFGEPDENENDFYIIYDEFDRHFDLCIGEPTLKKNIMITMEGKIGKLNGDELDIIFTAKDIHNRIKEPYENKTKIEYLFFDYETVIDFSKAMCMQPYSLSIMTLSEDEISELSRYDDYNEIGKISFMRNEKCKTFFGFDCSDQFIEWLILNQENRIFKFVSFNGSSFDNFILIDALLRFEKEGLDIDVGNIFYNGSQLLNMWISGRHDFFDLCKHLVGSLSANCKSFKIKSCAKKSFDHSKAQEMFKQGTLIDFINNNPELKEYNEYDVISTAILFYRYKKALLEIPCAEDFAKNLHAHKTIGGLIYKIFSKSIKNKNIQFPKLDYKKYSDLLKYKVAGRVECFNGKQNLFTRIASMDVCSLYPYIMAVHNGYFPHGQIIETEEFNDENIGFYYCDIDQRNLRNNNLPIIYPKKTETENIWDHDEVLHDYLIGSPMIKLLREYGCSVQIKNGFYFTEQKKSCDMFDFILDLMKGKNMQDTYKKNNDPRSNPSLREAYKLLSNSLSGKVIEGLHLERTVELLSLAHYNKIEKNSRVNFIDNIGGRLFGTYKKNEEEMINQQRPIFLGCLIYEYARSYMYRNAYSKFGLQSCIYTDTDSIKIKYDDFIVWADNIKNIIVPHWPEVEKYDNRYSDHKIYEHGSKVYGSFEDEYEDIIGEQYRAIFLAKKNYLYGVDGHYKFKIKGVNPYSILINGDEKFVDKIINKKTNDVRFTINDKEQAYEHSINSKAIKNDDIALHLYEKLYNDGCAQLLCSNFRKIVKNSLKDVSIGEEDRYNNNMNKIQVNFTIKNIRV